MNKIDYLKGDVTTGLFNLSHTDFFGIDRELFDRLGFYFDRADISFATIKLIEGAVNASQSI